MAYNILLAKKQSKISLEQAAATAVAFDGDNSVEASQSAGFWQKVKDKYEFLQTKVWFLIIITVAGLGMVVGGAQLVVNSAQFIAKDVFHIPAEIVALTVVAFGTSLPELVTSVSAAKKGDVGIATGNVIGSNIANVLLIGGVGALCTGANGLPFTAEGLVSGLVALGASVIVFASCWGKTKSVSRIAGVILLLCLAAYYAFVFLNLYVFKLY